MNEKKSPQTDSFRFKVRKKLYKFWWSAWKRTVGAYRYGMGRSESFSQGGEDLIVTAIWKKYLDDKSDFRYLDIGAHHPIRASNTCLLYRRGARGINIEADPVLFELFPKERTEDTNLNIGIGAENSEKADFYVMKQRDCSTFSREMMEYYTQANFTCLDYVVQVPLRTIDSVLESLSAGSLDFVNIDVEGLDFSILKAWNFERYHVSVFCVETNKEDTCDEIRKLMRNAGYVVFEQTGKNTIFVDKKILTR